MSDIVEPARSTAPPRRPPGAIDPRQLATAETLERLTWVKRPLAEVFAFFADAKNLEVLTPPWLNFRILTPGPIEMRVGALIDYRIGMYGVPMKWQTLITDWQPPHRFVDEQLSGPYSIWWHEHTFLERDGATAISDRVLYRAPFHFLSGPLLVRRELKKIFDYRTSRIRELFGKAP